MLQYSFICLLSSLILLTVILICLVSYATRLLQIPPGPWGLPGIGYLPWLDRKMYESFVKIGKKYGSVFSVTLGGETVIVLNDWSSIKEALVDQPKVFSGRPRKATLDAFSGRKDITFSDGPVWKKQRNLAVQCLRSIGVGKSAMDGHLLEMVQEIIDKLHGMDNQVVEMEYLFFGPLLKSLLKSISNHNIINEDGHVGRFEVLFKTLTRSLRANNPVNVFPWLRFLPMDPFGYWKFIEHNGQLLNILKEAVDDQMANWDGEAKRNIIDYYIKEILKKRAENNNELPYNEHFLLGTIYNLLGAGVDTTSGTLSWGFIHLVHHPHTQRKLQFELDCVIGRQRLPNRHDLPNLPYLDAFIKEVHRFSTIFPLSIFHRTTATTVISGYTIPQDTTVIQNTFAVHYDPNLWEEPEIFKPERFLDDDNKVKTVPYLIPFSIGPRLCIGQALAELELRLIVGCLVHRFNFSLPPGVNRISLEPELRITIVTQPYSLHIQSRD